MMTLVADLLAVLMVLVIASPIYALIIWLVGKLRLGLEVSGFGAAFFAALVIVLLNSLVILLLGAIGLTLEGDLLAFIIQLVIAALILLIADRIVKGFYVNSYKGALLAALAIAAVGWLISWIGSLFA
jgi:putative membrane protein